MTKLQTQRSSVAPRATGLLCVFVSLLVLLGWLVPIDVLTRLVPGWPSMKVNSAMGIGLLGVATLGMAAKQPHWRWIVSSCAAGAFALGALSMIELLTNLDFAIDTLLADDVHSVQAGRRPGLMSAGTALSLCAMGTTILLRERRFRIPSQVFAMGVLGISLLPSLSYSYQIEGARHIAAFESMAAHTSLSFLALSVTWLLADQDFGVGRWMAGDSAVQRLTRWIGVPLVLTIWSIGLISVQSIRSGYDPALVSLFQIASSALLTMFLVRSASNVLFDTERALDDSSRRWTAVVEASPDAVLLSGPDERVEAMNSMAPVLFGQSEPELIGQSLGTLFEGEDDAEESNVPVALAKDSDWTDRTTTVWRSGQKVPVEVRRRRVDTAEGQMTITLVRDITRRLDLEEQLRRSQKLDAVAQLAGGVAHDFNNLLSVITTYTALVKEELSDRRFDEDLQAIQGAAERGASLSRQLLAFSTDEVSRPQVLSVSSAVGELHSLLLKSLGEDIKLAVEYEGTAHWRTYMDPGHFDQLLINLSTNARQAMPQGGELTIRVRHALLEASSASLGLAEGEYVVLSVSDTGTGMTPEIQDRIFEPFFTTRSGRGGTGLGLAMCHGLARKAGGAIEVQSELGHGTCFRVYLPRHEGRVTASIPVPTTAENDVVLLVEDNDGLRAATARLLRSRVGEVLVASSAEEALRVWATRGRIDVLVTDVVMPGMSGAELVSRMRRLQPYLPVLYVSGYSNHSVFEGGSLDSDCVLVEKPFQASDLLTGIADAKNLQQKRSRVTGATA